MTSGNTEEASVAPDGGHQTERYDTLIAGGEVVDPGAGLSGRLDVAIHDGKVVRVEADLDRTAADVMTRNPVTIRRETLAAEALLVLERRKITSIVVVDADRRVQGVVHLHDLWGTEMI